MATERTKKAEQVTLYSAVDANGDLRFALHSFDDERGTSEDDDRRLHRFRIAYDEAHGLACSCRGAGYPRALRDEEGDGRTYAYIDRETLRVHFDPREIHVEDSKADWLAAGFSPLPPDEDEENDRPSWSLWGRAIRLNLDATYGADEAPKPMANHDAMLRWLLQGERDWRWATKKGRR